MTSGLEQLEAQSSLQPCRTRLGRTDPLELALEDAHVACGVEQGGRGTHVLQSEKRPARLQVEGATDPNRRALDNQASSRWAQGIGRHGAWGAAVVAAQR